MPVDERWQGSELASGPSFIDRSEVRDDPSGAGGALGVSSDAKDERERGARSVGEERPN